MVMKPGRHQKSKQRGQDLGWKVHDRAHLLFFAHTLCMSYVIAMFLLVIYMNTRNHLSYFVRFCARSTLKIVNKTYNKELCRASSPFPSFNYTSTILICFRSSWSPQPVLTQSRTHICSTSTLHPTHAHFQPSLVSPSLYAASTARPGEAFPDGQICH